MKKIAIFLLCILISCCSCRNSSVQTDSSSMKKEQNYDNLSNETQGWGFRRTENGPQFTQEQIRQMSQYDCIYRESGNEKTIYLTFDEGYENGYTSVILDILRQKSVRAAFFVTGPYVKNNPDLIKRMKKDGHIIGNHTVNHPSLPETSYDELLSELAELDRLVYGICGIRCRYLRPPKGEYSERTLAITQDAGYTNVFWSQAYVDWNNDVSSSEAFRKITKDIHPGCVLLLHAVSRGNAEALGEFIDYARKEGYTFRPLGEYKQN